MTGPPDSVDTMYAFRRALPSWALAELLGDAAVHAWLMQAVTAGWDIDKLAEHVTYHARGLANAGQVMRHRLHRAADPEYADEHQ